MPNSNPALIVDLENAIITLNEEYETLLRKLEDAIDYLKGSQKSLTRINTVDLEESIDDLNTVLSKIKG